MPGAATARIALHAGAIPHQPGIAALAGSAVFSAVAASPWPRRAVGPEEGDRGEVAKSAVQIQRNARRSRPSMPDTQLAGFSDCSDGRIGAVSRRSEPAAIGRA